MRGTVDVYKKLSIKRDSKAPSAVGRIKAIMDPAFTHLYKSSAFLLENYVGPSKASDEAVPLKKKKSFRGILKPSKSDIKRSHIFDIDPEQISFNDIIPIHLMWKEYIKDLLGDTSKIASSEISQKFSALFKIAKCDLHGAVISVFEAKNKALIGLEGIVVKESRHTFTIICPSVNPSINASPSCKDPIESEQAAPETATLKIVPKMGLTFLVKVPGGPKVKVFGDSVCFRSSERSGLKFKQKYGLDFF
ncbi:unnamed protein product [Moneuplotes crassus]|uniref:Uncharacterized protein n=1 Tax=Euplotes crassus TaxID=5936 RepID=A0AAD1XKN2_EUPCR|nr:unnamed protein product [Moneuplotes crassus]